jgi:YesN/AraC family two-component response regulator
MVCDRCIATVRNDLKQIGIGYKQINLGTVELDEPITREQKIVLAETLVTQGFELLENKNSKLIEGIKNEVIKVVRNPEARGNINYSQIIADKLNHDYNSLSSLFSSVEAITIEKYIIHQKIEWAKELLFYDELNLNEIADKLGYRSVQHLSAQFKKVTGMTPTVYKKLGDKPRKPLDRVG